MRLGDKSSHRIDGQTKEARENLISIPCQVIVKDIACLWNNAFSRMIAYRDMTSEDIIETIGPREDPNVNDCLLTILDLAMRELSSAECEMLL